VRPALPLSIALLLIASSATLGLKASFTDYNAIEDNPRLDRDVVALLRRDGFAVTTRIENQRPPTFYGERDGCRVMLRHATDPGSFGYNFRLRAAGIGPLRYRIGSAEFDEAPAMRLWVGELIARTWRSIGMGTARPAPVVIAVGAGCAGAPDTTSLRIYPRITER
jgi:hypothetical protein